MMQKTYLTSSKRKGIHWRLENELFNSILPILQKYNRKIGNKRWSLNPVGSADAGAYAITQQFLKRRLGDVMKSKKYSKLRECDFCELKGDSDEIIEIDKETGFFLCIECNDEYENCDQHIGCPSYPNCDIAPNGCVVKMGINDVEFYGHKD